MYFRQTLKLFECESQRQTDIVLAIKKLCILGAKLLPNLIIDGTHFKNRDGSQQCGCKECQAILNDF